MTNQEVAEAFARGENKGHSNNIFIDKRPFSTIIYSYGYHFPIAIRTSDFFAFFNSDRYSQTTACHKSKVKQALISEGLRLEEKTTEELKEIIKTS